MQDTIKVRSLVDEDTGHYKETSFFIETSLAPLSLDEGFNFSMKVARLLSWNLISHYMDNPLMTAIVFKGDEPFQQYEGIFHFIKLLREDRFCMDTVVIYSDLSRADIHEEVERLKIFPNIIVKFEPHIREYPPYFDNLLGATLSSDNQYALKIS